MAHKAYGLNELREMFLAFFESKGHLRLPSFSLIPQNDPSLLIINSGMAPMKPYFTGEVEPPRHRVCTCQKCIRTGDIENIGKTARHGTYFEMLGNFSFGDYFKHESLAWSWEFLTSPEWVGLEPELLYPSVYEHDDEAYDIWINEIGVPKERVVKLGKSDNFWEHGSGPCGPCSEIYYDRGVEKGCGKPDCAPGCDCDRFMEVWNNVFSQFNNDGEGNYTDLVQKNIDTGMGLERLACVSQCVDSLFDVDTVMNITNKVSEITGATYGKSHKMDVSLRVITDHIRSATFMIGDGILPSNEGRGYVLRRLLRRAARHGRLLGVVKPFLYEVAETAIQENESAYPELREKQAYIQKLIRTEEERFAATVESGLLKLDEMIRAVKGNDTLPGEDAFRLYDTYGFPIDLTIEILEERNMKLAREAFEEMMKAQRQRAREARGGASLGWTGDDVSLKELPATRFIGYDSLEGQGKVLAIVTEGEQAGALNQGAEGMIVLDQTPFYAESGGQTWDQGWIACGDAEIRVLAVRKTSDGKFIHAVKAEKGGLTVDQTVTCTVDADRRQAVMRAHSATHLLQKALRTVLGDHVEQAGSLVEPDRLRFDFTHFSAVTPEQLIQVERLVNQEILKDDAVNIQEMPIDEAKKLGAMALFDEKYGDVVRVVRMGDYSIELCGGTHVPNTARVGLMKIVSEASVAASVRRIEAVTGREVMELLYQRDRIIAGAAAAMKAAPLELALKAGQLMGDLRQATHKVEALNAKMAAMRSIELMNFAHTAGESGVNVLAVKVDDATPDMLRTLSDSLREKAPNLVSVLAAVHEGKISFAAACGKEAVKKGAHAGNILKQTAKIAGGGGGGRPDSATAGGKDISKLEEALEAVNNIVENMVTK